MIKKVRNNAGRFTKEKVDPITKGDFIDIVGITEWGIKFNNMARIVNSLVDRVKELERKLL